MKIYYYELKVSVQFVFKGHIVLCTFIFESAKPKSIEAKYQHFVDKLWENFDILPIKCFGFNRQNKTKTLCPQKYGNFVVLLKKQELSAFSRVANNPEVESFWTMHSK